MKHEYTLELLRKRLVWEQGQLDHWRKQSGSYPNRQCFLFEKHMADIHKAIELLEVDQLI